MKEVAKETVEKLCLDRRSLFKFAGVGVGALALSAGPSEAEEVAETGSAGLRDTAHVRAYLESARL